MSDLFHDVVERLALEGEAELLGQDLDGSIELSAIAVGEVAASLLLELDESFDDDAELLGVSAGEPFLIVAIAQLPVFG